MMSTRRREHLEAIRERRARLHEQDSDRQPESQAERDRTELARWWLMGLPSPR